LSENDDHEIKLLEKRKENMLICSQIHTATSRDFIDEVILPQDA
jgi:hypothetical protein